MKKLILVIGIAVSIVSCNKNQKAVKTLDGEWNVTSMKFTEDNVSVEGMIPGLSATFAFDGCKLKKDEFCKLTTTSTFDGETETDIQFYRVTDDGETLELKDTESSTIIQTIEIIELTKTDLKLKQVDGEGSVEIAAEKK